MLSGQSLSNTGTSYLEFISGPVLKQGQVAVVEPQHKGTYPLKPPSIGKNVSFASPIATVLGGHNSSVMCEERQNSVARVGSAASPNHDGGGWLKFVGQHCCS
ncbi:hypothetical protein ZEAMMB73_Zm00001d023471 [Zea mays]|uniref:Uncharacterized protein n=1 Tax=Zea mays TaxID=4577 RepID=A0A1D6ITF6_MAIZE|nr:hypothetical protein ZEAMMB73_Zm00001d023471 [Zea mays]